MGDESVQGSLSICDVFVLFREIDHLNHVVVHLMLQFNLDSQIDVHVNEKEDLQRDRRERPSQQSSIRPSSTNGLAKGRMGTLGDHEYQQIQRLFFASGQCQIIVEETTWPMTE